MCSTPFGIKEGYTWMVSSMVVRRYTCSTPFGIKEGYTWRGRWPPRSASSAQRLSASKRVTLRSGARLFVPPPCAQRLSASKRVTQPRPFPLRRIPTRAQRLSASKRVTRASGMWRVQYACVLNAFRHQRGLHSTRVTICFLKTNIPVCHVLPRIWYISLSHYTAQPKKC